MFKDSFNENQNSDQFKQTFEKITEKLRELHVTQEPKLKLFIDENNAETNNNLFVKTNLQDEPPPLNKYDDDDFENNERMLEDDFVVFDKNAYFKEKLETLKEAANRDRYFDYFIEPNHIAEMLIDFNTFYDPTFDPRVYMSFFRGWQTKRTRNKKTTHKVNQNTPNEHLWSIINANLNVLNRSSDYVLDSEKLDAIQDIWQIDYDQRADLYLSWVEKFKQDHLSENEKLIEDFNMNAQMLQDLRMQEDMSILGRLVKQKFYFGIVIQAN